MVCFQVICDADLKFIKVVARWPGSVHDARILRNCPLFAAFEGNRPPMDGILLADSGYMIRSWLMTPVLCPTTWPHRRYNFAHSSTPTTVERSTGVAKQRWRCLCCGLRLPPQKACRVILVCCKLHNRSNLKLPPSPDDSDADREEDGDAFHFSWLSTANASHPQKPSLSLPLTPGPGHQAQASRSGGLSSQATQRLLLRRTGRGVPEVETLQNGKE